MLIKTTERINIVYPEININDVVISDTSYSSNDDNTFGQIIVTIPHRFPGVNEMIANAKKGNGGKAYSRLKKKYTSLSFRAFEEASILFQTVYIKAIWNERTKRRDPDNIMGGMKFILDGMVNAGVIPNDNHRYVKNINQSVLYSTKDRKIFEDFVFLQILGKILIKR